MKRKSCRSRAESGRSRAESSHNKAKSGRSKAESGRTELDMPTPLRSIVREHAAAESDTVRLLSALLRPLSVLLRQHFKLYCGLSAPLQPFFILQPLSAIVRPLSALLRPFNVGVRTMLRSTRSTLVGHNDYEMALWLRSSVRTPDTQRLCSV